MAVDNRLGLRVPTDLKDWAHDYAKRNNTSVSALVVRFLTRLRQADEQKRQQPVDAEQV